MAEFPLVCAFEGDVGLRVLVVDSENTIAEVAALAADQLAGVVVQPIAPGETLRVRLPGETEPLPDGTKVGEAGLRHMQGIEIYRKTA